MYCNVRTLTKYKNKKILHNVIKITKVPDET